MEADSIAFSPGPPVSTTIGSGRDLPEDAGITAKWMTSRRPSARSGFSSTLSAPHRAGWVTPGSWHGLVGKPGDLEGTASVASNPTSPSNNKALHDANVRLIE